MNKHKHICVYICVSEILKHHSNGFKIKLTIFPKIKVKKCRLENQRIITVQHLIKEAPTWRIGNKNNLRAGNNQNTNFKCVQI